MTRDDIIKLAREAGIPIEIDWAGRPSTLVVKDGGTYLRGVDDLERFANLVAAAEREACAKVCEQSDEDGEGPDCWGWHVKDFARAIRARGQKK